VENSNTAKTVYCRRQLYTSATSRYRQHSFLFIVIEDSCKRVQLLGPATWLKLITVGNASYILEYSKVAFAVFNLFNCCWGSCGQEQLQGVDGRCG